MHFCLFFFLQLQHGADASIRDKLNRVALQCIPDGESGGTPLKLGWILCILMLGLGNHQCLAAAVKLYHLVAQLCGIILKQLKNNCVWLR